jgi:isocitrate dehydrogenase kinase/phosphatase
MNERILELAKQAGLDYMPDHDLEKFAQLILHDCMSICEELGNKGMDGHYCVDEIRKHFGVEE